MSVKRLHYFHYQFLQEQDFTDEQSYHLSMRRRHNKGFHTWGRVQGMEVSFSAGERKVTISPGMAVDSLGREIVLESNYEVDLQTHPGETVYLVLAYKEEETDPTTQAGVAGNTRITESFQTPRVFSAATPPSDPSLELILAKITLNAGPPASDGAVITVDTSERTEAGAKIGQAALPGLKFTVPGHGGGEWPEMKGVEVSAPGSGLQGIELQSTKTTFTGKVSVSQGLEVNGDLTVRGVVNKTDELTIKDNIIRVNAYPPSPIPLIINGGLEVYRGGTAPNAQVIWDESADKWKVGLDGALDTVAGASEIADRFNVISGHDHDGTDSKKIPGFSSAHFADLSGANLTNLNGSQITTGTVSEARIDAAIMRSSAYGFANSAAADVALSQADNSGATRSIPTTFRPKLVWVAGGVSVVLGGSWFGTSISGFADLRITTVQQCSGATVTRLAAAPFWSVLTTGYSAICGARFGDLTVSPNRIEDLLVTITAVSNTGLTLTLYRTIPTAATGSYSALTNLNITLRLLCFG